MNYTELQAAILGDTHRENYADQIVRFIEQGEAYIRSRLEAYGLEYVLTDADRTVAEGPSYNFPARVSYVRTMIYNNIVLDQSDETNLKTYRDNGNVVLFCMRPNTVVFACTPPTGAEIYMQYMGMPPALSDANPTNALLFDYPQLYIDAASVYVFRRAQDYDSAQAAFTSANGILDQINRKMHKQLAGARPSNAYNVSYRSAY